MARDVYAELADAIRGAARDQAREVSPPVERFRVVEVEPLAVEQLNGDLMLAVDVHVRVALLEHQVPVEQLNGDLMLEEGDPDVDIDRGLLTDRPEVGDLVRVHHDGSDWIVGGVID